MWYLWVEGRSQEGSLLHDMLIFNLGAGQSQQPPGCQGDKVSASPSQSHREQRCRSTRILAVPRLNRQRPRDSGTTVRSLRGTSSSWYLRQITNDGVVPAASDQTRVRCYRMVLSLPQAMPRAEVPCLSCDGQEKYPAHPPLCFPTGVEGKVWGASAPAPGAEQHRAEAAGWPSPHHTHPRPPAQAGSEGRRSVTSHPWHVHQSTSQSHLHHAFIPIQHPTH